MGELDPRLELEALVGGVRALLEQLAEAGTAGLPSGLAAHRQARAQAQPHAEGSRAAHAEGPRPAHAEGPRPAPTQGPRPPPAMAARPAPAHADAPPPVRPARVAPPDHTGLGADARRLRLAEIAQVAAACTRCGLHEGRTHSVFARGNDGAELMFVGEGPGANEDAQGVPFVGESGQLLDKMIVAMGYAPDDVYIANVVKCRPPHNRKPEPTEAALCAGYVYEQIALVQPKVIVALGAAAAQALLGASGISNLRGTWRLYRGEIPVMPTFHPAYVLRTPSARRDVWNDLKQVMQRLGKGQPPPGR